MSNKIPYDEMRLKDLKSLAKSLKIPGWHEMKKGQIIPILLQMNSEDEKSKKKKKTSSATSETVNDEKKKASSQKEKTLVKPVAMVKSSAPSRKSASSSRVKKVIPSKLNVFSDEEKNLKPVPDSEPKKKSSPTVREEAKSIQTSDATPPTNPKAGFLKEKLLLHKTLETPSSGHEIKDRIVLLVCGPFWLHAWWEISGTLISRVRAAMGHLWHTADPILRLYRVFSDGAGLIHREFASDILIHGGIYNWFINVDNPPGSYLVEIGYKARNGQFFSLVSSNIVETPHNYIQESMGRSESGWRMLASSSMFSPLFDDGNVLDDPAIANADLNEVAAPQTDEDSSVIGFGNREFDLQIDAEVVIKGKTSPDVQLTIKGERIWLKEDGSFLIRYHLPERRHVFPVVAVSRDGIETKTIVLAVERNTKNLETVIRDQGEDDS